MLTTQQKRQLQELAVDTVIPAILEDLNIDSDDQARYDEACNYLMEQLKASKP